MHDGKEENMIKNVLFLHFSFSFNSQNEQQKSFYGAGI